MVPRIAHSFFDNAKKRPQKDAIWCDGASATYAQLADFVSRWSNAMALRGVQRGDHVGVLLPNCIEFVALMLVASDLGLVLVPLNTSLPASAIHRAFQAADVKHIIAKTDIVEILKSPDAPDFSFASGLWVSVGGETAGAESLDELIESAPPNSAPLFLGRDEDPFILTMTSGSTGDPKPIILTQQTKVNRALAAVEMYSVTDADMVLAATPLYHSLAERLVLIPFIIGGTSILMARYSPSEWLKCVSEQSVSFTISVSSQLRQIAQQVSAQGSNHLGSLRCLVSSSAQLETQIKSDLLANLSCQFHECYGTSEVAIATTLDVMAESGKIASVGRPAPNVEIMILREDGSLAAEGEEGEIICKTPMIFGGYFKRPDLTKAAMWNGYFRTGDIGKLDGEGYLYYLGRKKDIIITGGINVYPRDIELALAEHPSILESAAFPMPDDNLGEVVAVAIVPKQAEDFDLKQIRRHCAARLADFQQPRLFFVIDRLPKNEMGKVMKQSLPAFVQSSVARKS